MARARVFGLLMVRDEKDVVGLAIRHHLFLGLDRVLVVDNGSTDGTDRELGRLGPRVEWTRSDEAFRPGEIGTRLARQAAAAGADWVLPFDADELWLFPGRSLRKLLGASRAGALRAPLVNFVQRRERHESSAEGLLDMTWRVPRPTAPVEEGERLVESQEIAFVEAPYPPKWIARCGPELVYAPGYHAVSGVQGPLEDTDEAVILHAPLRSRAALVAKAEQGRRAEEAGFQGNEYWHSRRLHRLRREGRLEEEWEANSQRQGALHLGGRPRPLVFDPRLSDAAARLLVPWWKRFLVRARDSRMR